MIMVFGNSWPKSSRYEIPQVATCGWWNEFTNGAASPD